MSETRSPPNQRMAAQLEELKQITEATVSVEYDGGSLFILEARDNEFWNSVFNDLREHNYQINKHLDGEMYVEKSRDESGESDD